MKTEHDLVHEWLMREHNILAKNMCFFVDPETRMYVIKGEVHQMYDAPRIYKYENSFIFELEPIEWNRQILKGEESPELKNMEGPF